MFSRNIFIVYWNSNDYINGIVNDISVTESARRSRDYTVYRLSGSSFICVIVGHFSSYIEKGKKKNTTIIDVRPKTVWDRSGGEGGWFPSI